MYLVVIVFIHHDRFLNTPKHEKFIAKVCAGFGRVLESDSLDRSLGQLLLTIDFLRVSTPQSSYFLIFQFVLWHIRDLDDGIGILQLGRNAVENLHDLVK